MSDAAARVEAAYEAVAAKVDAFFERVATSHPGQMQCRRGCFSCCHPHLHLLPVEWARVAAAVALLTDGARHAIAARLAETSPTHCALLAEDGSCRVWAARPLVCRSHGLPVRMGTRRTACELNFRDTLAELPESDIVDQKQLSVVLGLIDRMARDALAADHRFEELDLDADGRVPLRVALRRVVP